MAVKELLLFFGLLIWASTMATSKADEIFAEEVKLLESSPVAMALRKGCSSDTECTENHYCGGRGTVRRCLECEDCSRFQRKPKKTYEGLSCATHQTDCGECFEGYEETGGICSPKASTSSTSTTTTSPIPSLVKSLESSERIREDSENVTASANPLIWIIVGCALFVVVIGTVVLWFGKRGIEVLNPSKRGRISEEEATLTDGPSAPPPEEDGPPPPYYQMAPETRDPEYGNETHSIFNAPAKSTRRKKVSFKKLQAMPFNRGNGAGDNWETEAPNEPGNIGDVPDQVDGEAMEMVARDAEHPQPEQAQPSPQPGPSNVPPARAGRGAGAVQRIRRHSQPRTMTHGMVRGMESRASQGERVDATLPDHSNPILAQLRVEAWAVAGVTLRAYGRMAPPADGANDVQPQAGDPIDLPTLQRPAISAPASPRQIDSTMVYPLPEIGGNFQASRYSLDSGTGTSEAANRSMQSRSASGNDVNRIQEFSDMDDSMYDDEMQPSPGEPYSPPAVETPATVPSAVGFSSAMEEENRRT